MEARMARNSAGTRLTRIGLGALAVRGSVARSLLVCGLLVVAFALAPTSASAQADGCVYAPTPTIPVPGSLSKTDTPDPVAPGGRITYTITFDSDSLVDPTEVIHLTDVLPPQTTFVSFTAPAGWTTVTPPPGGTGTVTATFAPPQPEVVSATFVLVVDVLPAAVATTVNTVTVEFLSVAPNPTLCTATATTTIGEKCKDKPGTDKDKCKKPKDKA
jgi:uncharacterized repeat protein (TIGR01451 family)